MPLDNFDSKLNRPRKGKNTPFSVLIVCEGENTEPNYFNYLEKFLNDNFSQEYPYGVALTLFPLSKNEVDIIEKEDLLFPRVKKTKSVKTPGQIINEDVEDKYKSEPIRWVRYAQKQSIKSGFDSLWSVFDYDNRNDSDIEAAFTLSKNNELNNQLVEIAYSSYSFEYWILLHYELFLKNIPKSQCKDENNSIIHCGKNLNSKDCKGVRCLVGYLEINQYIAEVKDKYISFNYSEKELINACIRAEYSRSFNFQGKSSIWEVKPITTVDNLITFLLPSYNGVEWSLDLNNIDFDYGTLNCELSGNMLSINLESNGNKTLIIHKDDIKIYNSRLEYYGLNNKIILREKGGKTLQHNLNGNSSYNYCISIKIESKYYFSMIN